MIQKHESVSSVKVISAMLLSLALGFMIASASAREREARLVDEQTALRQSTVAKWGAHALVETMLAADYTRVQRNVRDIAQADDEIEFARVELPDGRVVTECFPSEASDRLPVDSESAPQVRFGPRLVASDIEIAGVDSRPKKRIGRFVLGFKVREPLATQTAGVSPLATEIGLAVIAVGALALLFGPLPPRRLNSVPVRRLRPARAIAHSDANPHRKSAANLR